MAKRMLSVDKELATVAWLLRGDQTVQVFVVPMPDQRSKMIQMNRLADLVEQSNADGMIFISESWVYSPASTNAEPAAVRQNRGECILVSAATRDGQSAETVTIFTRGKNGEISFEPSTSIEGGQLNALQPVVRRWQQIAMRPFMAKKRPKGQGAS